MKSINTGNTSGNIDAGSREAAYAAHGAPVRASSAGNGMRTVEGGKILQGEIIDLIGKNVKLQMANGQMLSARLESALQLSIGQKASFLVTDADAQHITLKVMAQDETILENPAVERALDAAGLPKTERNREAVAALLENKLSIDKTSIHRLLANSVTSKNASFETLAQMMRFNIPINETTAAQYEAYRNYEHQLMKQFADIGSGILELVSENAGQEDFAARNLEILKLVLESAAGEAGAQRLPAAELTGGQTADDSTLMAEAALKGQGGGAPEKAVPEALQQQPGEAAILTPASERLEGLIKALSFGGETDGGQNARTETGVRSDEARQALTGRTGEADESLADKSLKLLKNIYDSVRNIAPGDSASQQLAQELFSLPQYQRLMSRMFMRGMLLKPEELSQKESLNGFYESLGRKLENLQELAARTDTPASKLLRQAVDSTKGNLDFMRTLNNIFTYVQLPLQMKGGQASGELYVYARKKRLLSDDGSIRVLLHLNMDSLGRLDVHLTLKGVNLTASFYSEDEISVKLLSEHMDSLKRQLGAKGYILDGQVAPRKAAVEHIKEFLTPEDEGTEVKRYTFDIRA